MAQNTSFHNENCKLWWPRLTYSRGTHFKIFFCYIIDHKHTLAIARQENFSSLMDGFDFFLYFCLFKFTFVATTLVVALPYLSLSFTSIYAKELSSTLQF